MALPLRESHFLQRGILAQLDGFRLVEGRASTEVAEEIPTCLVSLTFRIRNEAGEEDLAIALVANGDEERVVDDHVEWRRRDHDGGGANSYAGGGSGLGSFFVHLEK